MNPRPPPHGSGEPEERPKPQGHTTARHGNGSGIKKKGEWKEKWMGSDYLARLSKKGGD
jgi:hypothetical protein